MQDSMLRRCGIEIYNEKDRGEKEMKVVCRLNYKIGLIAEKKMTL